MRLSLATLFVIMIASAWANEEIPDLEISRIEQGIFLHRSFSQVDGFGLVSSNGLVVVNDGKAFIVDTPWSARDTEKLVEWIGEQGFALRGSISTHSHDDRTAGIEWLNAHDVPTYASALTNEFLQKEGKTLASHSFDQESYSLGGGLLEAFYPGPGHARDNIVVWVPGSEVLFGGCLIRSLGSKGLGYTGEADIGEWPRSVDRILARYPGVQLVVPGHGKPGDIQLLVHTKALTEEAGSATK